MLGGRAAVSVHYTEQCYKELMLQLFLLGDEEAVKCRRRGTGHNGRRAQSSERPNDPVSDLGVAR